MHNKDPRLFYFSKIALVYNRFALVYNRFALVYNQFALVYNRFALVYNRFALVYNRFDEALDGKHLINNVDMYLKCIKSLKFDKLVTIDHKK